MAKKSHSISAKEPLPFLERAFTVTAGEYALVIWCFKNGICEITKPSGELIARYDPEFNETRDVNGRYILRGNSLNQILLSDFD